MKSLHNTPIPQEVSLEERDQLISKNTKLESQLQHLSSRQKEEYDMQRTEIDAQHQVNKQNVHTEHQNQRKELKESLIPQEQERKIQEFLEAFSDAKEDLIFQEIPSFMQIDIRIIEQFVQYNSENPDAHTFHFQDIPESWYQEHITTSQGISTLLSL